MPNTTSAALRKGKLRIIALRIASINNIPSTRVVFDKPPVWVEFIGVRLTLGGPSVGGVIWLVMFDQVINDDGIGYAWTMREQLALSR